MLYGSTTAVKICGFLAAVDEAPSLAVMRGSDELKCSDACRMSGGDNDGGTVVVIGDEDIVQSVMNRSKIRRPAIPEPLRGKFNAGNLHSVVSIGDRDVVLDSA